jgi:mRNA-degrading endonuclease YafQ of YafQ-DinJ toxin-antitoxin module
MFILVFGKNFWEIYQKICGRNQKLRWKIVKTLKQLAFDPKQPGLKTHKVGTKQFGERWATRVTGDLRIIWDYSQEQGKLLILS